VNAILCKCRRAVGCFSLAAWFVLILTADVGTVNSQQQQQKEKNKRIQTDMQQRHCLDQIAVTLKQT
jgi:hypothetical protein